VGENVTEVFSNSSDACEAGDPSGFPSDGFFRVGPVATDLHDVEIAEIEPGSRLQDRYWSVDGVQLELLLTAYDTEGGADCMFVPISEGKMACVPGLTLNISGGSSEVFADDGCTQALVPGSTLRCEPKDFGYIIMQSTDYCTAGVADIYVAGDPFSSDTVYVKNGDSCGPSSTNPDTVWYERKEKLVVEEAFGIFTETVDK
jgi:hypothetical protein